MHNCVISDIAVLSSVVKMSHMINNFVVIETPTVWWHKSNSVTEDISGQAE